MKQACPAGGLRRGFGSMAKKSDTMSSSTSVYQGGDLFERLGKERFESAGDSPFRTKATAPQDFNLDNYVGYTFRDLPILDKAGVVGQIDSGTSLKYPNGTVTFGFLDKSHLVGLYNNPTLGFTADNGITPFSNAQRAEARQAVQLWDDLIPVTFVEKNGIGADIVFANSRDPAQAYAYYPTIQGYSFQSDVFVADPNLNITNKWLSLGGYGATTLVHELGHTIGLSHPGKYNYDPELDLTYDNYAEYAQDSLQYSIMSYWVEDETGGATRNWATLQFNNPQTPMLHDILTVQDKYGADLTTRAGDTIYGFGSNTGRDVFDFAQNKWPFLSIYDAGGSDTINLSGFTAGQFLDLHAGSFSSVGQGLPTLAEITQARVDLGKELGITLGPRTQTQVDALYKSYVDYSEAAIAADTGVTGIRASQFDNFSIAYGTTIENGIGGSARDLLWGNEVANRLEGRAGNDVLDGFEGKDTLVGGDGADVFTFHNIEKGDHIADFSRAQGDKIDLHALDDATFDFSFIGSSAFSGQAGEVRYAGGEVQVDLDGVSGADLTIILDNQAPLQATDFIFG
jgi:serralysin